MKRATPEKPQNYAGECVCAGATAKGDACTKTAYYLVGKKSYCGRHADKDGRKKLPKNPALGKQIHDERVQRQKQIDEAAGTNKTNGVPGDVICSKLGMMKSPDARDGYLLVFPNNKHGTRKDGYGCPELSPMQLGPVIHHQKDLPNALTIENYHQFNKCFPNELDEEGNPMAEFYTKRDAAYLDPIPHRHKFPASELKKMNKGLVNGKNTPTFSVHLDPDGTEKRYTYVESRFFYARQYELLAKQTDAFKILQQKLQDGYNLQLVGYDGYEVTEELYTHYCDGSRPFGHELCLYSLLTMEDPAQYPWNAYRAKHPGLYPECL